MLFHEYGNPEADLVLLQMVDSFDLAAMENEVASIRALCGADFRLIAAEVGHWNADLSPWEAPAVIGKEGFAGKAHDTLESIKPLCADANKTYLIGGYSLAGLFALWAACETSLFAGVAAASPSVWFPGFSDYIKERPVQSGAVYLSLGDREEKTRNPVMATVAARIREIYEVLCAQGVDCTLKWNSGNHFQDPAGRTAAAFAWTIRHCLPNAE